MARAPMAVWNRCPGSEPAIRPTQFIFHTAVMRDLFDLQDYFCSGRSGGIESHFGVGGKWGRSLAQDGMARQWRDSEEQADANLRANLRPDGTGAISVETCDNAPRFAKDIEEWTPKQAAKLVQLGLWARTTHSIPVRICRTPDDPGYGWHAMWDNTRFELPDGSTPWTPSAGKECPGPTRIAQLKTVILPAIFAGTQLEDDMTADEHAALLEVQSDVNKILQAMNIGSGPEAPVNQDTAYQRIYDRVRVLHERPPAPTAAEIAAAVVAALPSGPAGTLTKQDVEDALRTVFADGATP